MRYMTDLDLAGKRVLLRLDLNVPLKDGNITSDARIEASLPGVRQAIDAGAKVILMSHLGRPTEGEPREELSLRPVARRLSELLGMPVHLVTDYLSAPVQVSEGGAVLLENVRFNIGEKSNDEGLSRAYASLCDVYVMDAFGAAHRAHASTHGVARYAEVACAGPLLASELAALGKVMERPREPLVAVVGGSKVSTKLGVLQALSGMVDRLIPGGGIANTFIAAAGHAVGRSLYEPDFLGQAAELSAAAQSRGGEIPLPSDVVVGTEVSASADAEIKPVERVGDDEMILDIGPATAERYAAALSRAGTILWNGPVGVFEYDQFGGGTEAIARAIAESGAYSVAGGGDTLAAIDKYGVRDGISYISTGGGAFLEFIEGKTLPAVEILEQRG